MEQNKGSNENAGNGEPGGEINPLEGTPFKTPDEAAKGYLNLKALHDAQANELGLSRKELDYLRSQNETLNTLLKERSGGGEAKAKGPDYDAEIAEIEKQIQTLDPMEDGYSKTLAALVAKSNQLTAKAQHERTLGAASELFKKELSERDQRASKDAFLRDNPSFNTPEMQTRIREFIANDRTGMHDPLSAFREIERDDARNQLTAIQAENAEMKKLLELNKGRDEAGRVVTKSHSTNGQQTKQPKVTGKDLDAGMMAVLQNLNG